MFLALWKNLNMIKMKVVTFTNQTKENSYPEKDKNRYVIELFTDKILGNFIKNEPYKLHLK